MTSSAKMKLIVAPMIIVVFIGLKTFLDHQMVLLPILCILLFIFGFILLVKWNAARLRGR